MSKDYRKLARDFKKMSIEEGGPAKIEHQPIDPKAANRDSTKQSIINYATYITEKNRKQEIKKFKLQRGVKIAKRKKHVADIIQGQICHGQMVRPQKMNLRSDQIFSCTFKNDKNTFFEKSKTGIANMDSEEAVKVQHKFMEAEQSIKMLQQERKLNLSVQTQCINERKIAKQMSLKKRKAAAAYFAKCEQKRVKKAIANRIREEATFEHLNAAKTDAIKFIRRVVEAHKEDLERKNVAFDNWRLEEYEKDRRRNYEDEKNEKEGDIWGK